MKNYKVGEAAEILGVSVSTLQRWDREGRLKAYRTVAGRRYYTQKQLNEQLGVTDDGRKNVIYTRATADLAIDDLANQERILTEYCNATGVIVDEIISEIDSGLNYDRPKWNRLLQEVEGQKVNKIFVTHKDRFMRFGFDWIEKFCIRHGSEIIVVNNPKTSPDQELVDDLVNIIKAFSDRLPVLQSYMTEIKNDSKLKDLAKSKKANLSNYTQISADNKFKTMQAVAARSNPAYSQDKKQEESKVKLNETSYTAHIFTDGSCRSNGTHKGGHVLESDKSAWAYLIEYNGQRFLDRNGRFGATNNEMEMKAFLESLKKLEELGLTQQPLLFTLDSLYVIKSVSNRFGEPWIEGWKKRGWKKANGKPLANWRLWQEIDIELSKFDMAKLKFEWVPGHTYSEGNNYVDRLCNEYMDQM